MTNNRGFDSHVDELDGPLREAVQQICAHEPPAARVDACLVAIAATSSGRGTNRPHDGRTNPPRPAVDQFESVRRHGPLRRRWLPWIAASSILVAVIAVIWNSSHSVSLADVARAVKLQKWIHVRQHGSDGRESEFWLSPANDVSATKSSDRIEFHDDRLKLDWSFDVGEGVLYRVPDVGVESRQNKFSQLATGLSSLLKNDSLPDDPLSTLGVFLGGQADQLQLDRQSIESVNVDGNMWLEYRLSVRHRQLEQPIEFAFRTHPQTRLPYWYRMSGRQGDRDLELQGTIEYPESGPGDIYALGVPQESRFVDRVPKDDVARLIAGVGAGRARFDNYRAIVVSYTDGHEDLYPGSPDVIHRKGDRMRRDMAYYRTLSSPEKPEDDADPAEWWTARLSSLKYAPSEICVGDVSYIYEHRHVTGPTGDPLRSEIASVKTYDQNLPPDQFIPPFYSLSPEYIARPPLGVPNRDFEPSIDPSPAEGPQDTVLLRVRHTGRKDPQISDSFRFWIDANRGFLVMRWDMPGNDGQLTSNYVVEEADRSPRGYWYAKRVRRTNAVRRADGTTRDQILIFHVDFDVEIPDELFGPQKPLPLENVLSKE